jgi:outer membrane protein TolC
MPNSEAGSCEDHLEFARLTERAEMKRRTILLVTTLLMIWGLGCPFFATGADLEKLTIDQAVEMALANNPQVKAARHELAVAQAHAGVARSRYYPQISFNGIGKLGLSGATNGLGLLGLPASPFWRNLADAGNVNQSIFDFGRSRHATSVARAEVQAGEYNLDQVRIEVAERAKVAVLKVLTAQRVIQVREQDVRERQGVERKAREFYEAGLSSKLDLDLAEVGLTSAELALAQARDDEEARWADLDAALGLPEEKRYSLTEPQIALVSPEPLDKEIDQALATRPDLKALQAEISAQQERVEYARSLRRPLLNGVFSGGYARFAQLAAGNLMVGGLGLFAPIYTGGGLEAQVRAEQANLDALRARYQSHVLAARNEVSLEYAGVRKALDSAQANQRIASYGEEALRVARTRYQTQLISFVDLLTAETAAESARANYAQALYDYQIAEVRLSAAMGLRP